MIPATHPDQATEQADDEVVEALRAIERTMRDFIERFDSFPSYLWAAPTAKMAEFVKAQLMLHDKVRKDTKITT